MAIGAGSVTEAEIWGSGSAVLAGLYIWGDSALLGSLLGLVNICKIQEGGVHTVALGAAVGGRFCKTASHSPAIRTAEHPVHGFSGDVYLG